MVLELWQRGPPGRLRKLMGLDEQEVPAPALLNLPPGSTLPLLVPAPHPPLPPMEEAAEAAGVEPQQQQEGAGSGSSSGGSSNGGGGGVMGEEEKASAAAAAASSGASSSSGGEEVSSGGGGNPPEGVKLEEGQGQNPAAPLVQVSIGWETGFAGLARLSGVGTTDDRPIHHHHTTLHPPIAHHPQVKGVDGAWSYKEKEAANALLGIFGDLAEDAAAVSALTHRVPSPPPPPPSAGGGGGGGKRRR